MHSDYHEGFEDGRKYGAIECGALTVLIGFIAIMAYLVWGSTP